MINLIITCHNIIYEVIGFNLSPNLKINKYIGIVLAIFILFHCVRHISESFLPYSLKLVLHSKPSSYLACLTHIIIVLCQSMNVWLKNKYSLRAIRAIKSKRAFAPKRSATRPPSPGRHLGEPGAALTPKAHQEAKGKDGEAAQG
ncbi:hypothetical protein [Acerihabitans arboris]|uniref:Uncharacterized protein n=1 Tax=Acerihabitans arboris TaxID=2691583 RepID=A0A845SNA0_9GAMM|nr:hypothetical protein [Acerihabitans arboris]NDL64404.1 hypothetical protein [Acerihabitans arboris]